ncbi:F-box domain-containing protein [Colletotrichum sublineola]|nr:F-box domain-containing protein [Colletotrichum sublineola]
MPTGWNFLPLELQWMIRDQIKSISPATKRARNVFPYSQLLLVCREWHSWFCDENFRFLVLDQDRLDEFKNLVSNNEARRNRVQRIVLRIRLPDYDYPACDEEEDDDTACTNDEVFIDTLRRFMAIMSTWPKREGNPGIVLDLGAYSPSDGKHGFRDYRFSDQYQYGAPQAGYQEHAAALRRAREAGKNQKSTCPGWNRICNTECSTPSVSSKKRLLATIGDPQRQHFSKVFTDGHQNTPSRTVLKGIASAPAIVYLDLRRHYYRPISFQVLGCLVRQGFPYLRGLCRETWRAAGIPQSRSMDGSVGLMNALRALPATMQHFRLLCESNKTLQGENTLGGMACAAAKLSTRLRTFCATYTVSFEDFVHADFLQGSPIHRHLHSLCMTSSILQDRVSCNSQDFINLVEMAGCFAFMSMPKLNTLILWDGGQSDGFLMQFTYTYSYLSGIERRRPTLTIQGTRYARDDLLPAVLNLNNVVMKKLPQQGYSSILVYCNESHATGRKEKQEEEGGPAVTKSLHEHGLEFREVRPYILNSDSAKQRMFERPMPRGGL